MMSVSFWKSRRCRQALLDRTRPKPSWLELEPGEEYIGSYPRWRIMLKMFMALGIGLLFAGLQLTRVMDAMPDRIITLITISAAIGPLLIGLMGNHNRVYLTSKALVYKERKQYHVIELAQIAGVSYSKGLQRNCIYLHLHESPDQAIKLMDSPCLRETAEELSQLIAQFSGGEVQTEGGRK